MSLSENEGVDGGAESGGTLSKTIKECLTEDPSDTNGSGPIDPNTVYPRGSEDTGTSLADERREAFDKWKA